MHKWLWGCSGGDCSLSGAMRPDRVTTAMGMFVAATLGARYIEQPPFSMRETFEDSSAPTPLFFVLFPGVDPGAEIEKLGRQLG